MKNRSKKPTDSLRKELEFSKLGNGARGKYHSRALSGSNLVLIEPDLITLFPDGASVNRALRVLADAAKAVAPGKRPSSR
jgi:hypothetical protein